MRYIFWFYIVFSDQTDCKYERVGIFSEADSLHIVSNTLNYHFRAEPGWKQKEGFEIYSQNHPDSLFAIQTVVANDGIVIFISEISKRRTAVLSGKCNLSKSLANQ